jgi:hypothetical protein
MADWTAPFHMPKFEDEKFASAKAAYIARNGYTVTLPAFDDVIHLERFAPLTEQETKLWTGKIPAEEIPDVPRTADEIFAEMRKTGGPVSPYRRPNGAEMKEYRKNAKNMIPEERRQDIAAEKAKRKQKYLAQLASPQPKILRSAAAVLTSLDDAQDALSTLACIGMISCAVIGGTTAAALTGPLGWVIGATTLLNLLNPMSRMKGPRGKAKTGRAAKKDTEKFTDKNPFSKKSRAKYAKNIRKFRPSVANLIELAQVTQNIFGIGISIGPVMGFAQDLAVGGVLKARGEKVGFRTSPPIVPKHVQVAQRALKAQSLFHGVGWQSDMMDETASMIAANLACQAVTPYLQDWNPCNEVDDLENCMVEAPRPTDPLTIEIIEESGIPLDNVCNWPQNGERFITLGELQEKTAPQATANLVHFAEANRNSVEAFIACQNAHDFALGAIEAVEGPGSVWVEYSIIERIVLIILDNGWCYPDDITDAQVTKFEDWCYVHAYMNTMPTYKDIWRYPEIFCGFTWATSPDEYR